MRRSVRARFRRDPGTQDEDRRHPRPGHRRSGRARPARRRGHGLRARELLARRRGGPAAPGAAAVREASERAGRLARPAVRPAGPQAAALRRDRDARRSRRARPSSSRARRAASAVVVDFEGFARLCTPQSEIVIGDGVPRMTVAGVERAREVTRACASPGAAVARARASTSPTRGPSCPRSPRRTSPTCEARGRRAPTSSRSRSCAPRPTSSCCARGCASSASAPA